MRRFSKIVIGIIAISGAAYLGQFFIGPRNFVSYYFNLVGQPVRAFFESRFSQNGAGDEILSLRQENERLKAQMLFLSKGARLETLDGRNYQIAKIHSSYPFNDRGLISINTGSGSGVSESVAVTVGGDFFLGQAVQLFRDSSLVRTVYDTGWEIAVKIGTDQVDALLIGGREPRLTLILKDKAIAAGLPVYVAQKGLPYGLMIGTVKEITYNQASAFQEATLDFAYKVGDLTEVYVLR